MGEGRFTIRVRQNVSFIATFNDSAWFTLVTGSSLAWSVCRAGSDVPSIGHRSIQQRTDHHDVTYPSLRSLRNLVSYSIKINVADNDYDPYICLWSQGKTHGRWIVKQCAGALIDHYGCYLNFTPKIVGYYAVAITVQDYLVLPTNVSAVNYLSQVPIQFVFRVYNSTNPCARGPLYIGDLPADTCVYMSPGTTETVRIRFQVQCNNTNVTSIISVNPTGLLSNATPNRSVQREIFSSS